MNLEDRIQSAQSLLDELQAAPKPACSVCGTTERDQNVVPCHKCAKPYCRQCYGDHLNMDVAAWEEAHR